MNKIFKGAVLSLLTMIGFVSCTDSFDYTPASPDSGAYIYADATSKVYSPDDDFILTISIGRTDISEASTINLTSDNDSFDVPSSVDFAAGEMTKEIDIPFDMEIATTEKLTITIPDGFTVYGSNSLTFTITVDYNWIPAGTCTFTDYTFSENGAVAYNVPIMHADGTTNLYRIVQPFIAVWGNGEDGFTIDPGIKFTMNDDYTIDFVIGEDEVIFDLYDTTSKYSFCWPAAYADYCEIYRKGNYYEVTTIGKISGDTTPYLFPFAFEWTTGWPGQE